MKNFSRLLVGIGVLLIGIASLIFALKYQRPRKTPYEMMLDKMFDSGYYDNVLEDMDDEVEDFEEMTEQGNKLQRDGAAAAVRAAVSLYYAEKAAAGNATFPSELTAGLFADGEVPSREFGRFTWSYDPETGSVTTN